MYTYYNERDPNVAAWLRELIVDGWLPEGIVDERDIQTVDPAELHGFTQCHFFAGIGGWPWAMRLAGWPDDRPVWTGSCPCQPFSTAGKGAGFSDARHLWPAWHRLIAECRPPIIFGEQVDAAIRWGWWDLVATDLEGLGYACGAADLPSASVGAPDKRQRLWWVGELADGDWEGRREFGRAGLSGDGHASRRHDIDGCGETGELADAHAARCGMRRPSEAGDGGGSPRLELAGLRPTRCVVGVDHVGSQGRSERGDGPDQRLVGETSVVGALGDARGNQRRQVRPHAGGRRGGSDPQGLGERSGDQRPCSISANGLGPHWSRAQWLLCRDGKSRPVESGIFPLAHGVPGRVGLLRGAGNAINPYVAAAFIEAYLGV